jgi:hypothetical protein
MNAHLHPIFRQALAPFAPASKPRHVLSEERTGFGLGDAVTPVCSCGWRGRPESNASDWQCTNLREQQAAHRRAVEGL